MGFGSYDESERDDQQLDAGDVEASEHSALPAHDGDLEFEYDDASSEDLLETYREFRSQ